MNFTHLLPDHEQPPQELLQKYSTYLVIVILSDEMKEFALNTTRFELESTENVLCQIVFPQHIDFAMPGSLLNKFKKQLEENRQVPNTHHSFIATTTKAELTQYPPTGGTYYPLMLNTLDTVEEREKFLRKTVSAAIDRSGTMQSFERIKGTLKVLGSAAGVVGAIYRMSNGVSP